MQVSRSEVLKLYRTLIIYSKTLKLTDSAYFRRRITEEFKNNKTLTKSKDIDFAYQVQPYCEEVLLCRMIATMLCRFQPFRPPILAALKHTIDYSKVPQINETDLTEQFVRGGGPGGSAVNKNANCVVLTHLPTGVVIKCHISRCQDENRKIARELLITKLDEMMNGEDSVTSQKKLFEEKKLKKADYKKKKRAQLKEEWRKREGLV